MSIVVRMKPYYHIYGSRASLLQVEVAGADVGVEAVVAGAWCGTAVPAELNAVVGGFTVPKAIQAEEIYKVEHERMPPGVRSRLIREIEAGQILI